MGWITSQLDFVQNMVSSLRELVGRPLTQPADPLIEAFEADTVEHLFYRDGATWSDHQLLDTQRLLTLASYHRLALGEITRTLVTETPLSVPASASTSTHESGSNDAWWMGEVIDFSNFASTSPADDVFTGAADGASDDDDDAGDEPMVSGELAARIPTIPGFTPADRGGRINLLPIVAIPLLLLAHPLEARAAEHVDVTPPASEAAHEAGVPVTPIAAPADPTETSNSDTAPDATPDESQSSSGTTDIDGGTGQDTIAVEHIRAVATTAEPVAHAAHSSTPMSLITPSVEVVSAAHATTPPVATTAHIIHGTSGNDHLSGTDGVDIIHAGAGDDVILGSASADVIDGGADTDTVSYAASDEGVTVNLTLTTEQVSGGHASGDVLVNIENVQGSAYSDVITGDAGSNVIEGGGGSDIIDGGAGIDTVSYASSDEGVTVSLALPTEQVSEGHASGDILVSIENVVGSNFDDTLAGGEGANTLAGGLGNDTYIVTDNLDFVFEESMSGIDVVKTAIAHYTLTDNVENLTYTGSDNAILIGNDLDNIIFGGSLSDIIIGEGGSDMLFGGDGDDDIRGGDGDDRISGGSGSNKLDGGAGNDWLITFEGSDTLVLRQGFGHDTVEGFGGHGQGDGFDEIDISDYHFSADMFTSYVSITESGDNVLISIGNDTLTLLDTKVKDIDRSDFILS